MHVCVALCTGAGVGAAGEPALWQFWGLLQCQSPQGEPHPLRKQATAGRVSQRSRTTGAGLCGRGEGAE